MRNKIPVFKSEIESGLAEIVQSNASIAYYSPLVPLDPSKSIARVLASKVRASESDPEIEDITLFPIADILVTTGWNKNTDVFDRYETWASRYTSENKPFNFEHEENKIIGHITSSQAVDQDFNALDDDVPLDDLPDKFHILNTSVIYRYKENEAEAEFIEQTIAEIKEGKWFVSMECLFRGFDYGVIGPDGKHTVIARDEASAFLTKHLRQYGGSGTYVHASTGEEFQLGRILRNITFSGKGLVLQPANPESVILNNVNAFVPTFANLGYINAGTINHGSTSEIVESNEMSETNNEIKSLQDRITQLEQINSNLQTQLKEVDTNVLKAQITTLQSDLDAKNGEISNLQTQLETYQETVTTQTKRADEAVAELNTVRTELSTLKADAAKSSRVALMTKKGAPAQVAATLADKFAGFSDEQFNETVEVLAATWKTAQTTTQNEVTTSDIDNAEPVTEPALANTGESEETARASVRNNASSFIQNFLHHSK